MVRVMSNSQQEPTKVFDELSKELDGHTIKLEATLKTGIDAINPVLMNISMKAIIDKKK